MADQGAKCRGVRALHRKTVHAAAAGRENAHTDLALNTSIATLPIASAPAAGRHVSAPAAAAPGGRISALTNSGRAQSPTPPPRGVPAMWPAASTEPPLGPTSETTESRARFRAASSSGVRDHRSGMESIWGEGRKYPTLDFCKY